MNRSVIITGASGGIGQATARCFASHGWDLILGYYKNREAAEELAKELAERYGVRAIPFGGDLTLPEDCRRIVTKAVFEFGRVDTLVANAGVAESTLFTDVTPEHFRKIMDADLSSVFFTCQAAAKEMIAAGGGSIVTVSSIWGQVGAAMETVYSAAKAGVIGLTKAIAKELAPSHIRVNCVCPGVIDTEMNSCYSEATMARLAEQTPLGRIGQPEEVADSIYFLASEAAGFVTGQILGINGGFVI